jgi:hypothetical protein
MDKLDKDSAMIYLFNSVENAILYLAFTKIVLDEKGN